MGILVALLLGSVVFLCTIVIVAALMMRGQWEHLGGGSGEHRTPRQ